MGFIVLPIIMWLVDCVLAAIRQPETQMDWGIIGHLLKIVKICEKWFRMTRR